MVTRSASSRAIAAVMLKTAYHSQAEVQRSTFIQDTTEDLAMKNDTTLEQLKLKR